MPHPLGQLHIYLFVPPTLETVLLLKCSYPLLEKWVNPRSKVDSTFIETVGVLGDYLNFP